MVRIMEHIYIYIVFKNNQPDVESSKDLQFKTLKIFLLYLKCFNLVSHHLFYTLSQTKYFYITGKVTRVTDPASGALKTYHDANNQMSILYFGLRVDMCQVN